MVRLLVVLAYAGSMVMIGLALLGGVDFITGIMASLGMAAAGKMIEGDHCD